MLKTNSASTIAIAFNKEAVDEIFSIFDISSSKKINKNALTILPSLLKQYFIFKRERHSFTNPDEYEFILINFLQFFFNKCLEEKKLVGEPYDLNKHASSEHITDEAILRSSGYFHKKFSEFFKHYIKSKNNTFLGYKNSRYHFDREFVKEIDNEAEKKTLDPSLISTDVMREFSQTTFNYLADPLYFNGQPELATPFLQALPGKSSNVYENIMEHYPPQTFFNPPLPTASQNHIDSSRDPRLKLSCYRKVLVLNDSDANPDEAPQSTNLPEYHW